MKNLICIFAILLCSCSWLDGSTRRSTVQPQPIILPDIQIPKHPNVPQFEGYSPIPQGGKIIWPNGKTTKVGKGGGAYLDKLCVDNVAYAFKLWQYYADAVDSQITTYNKGLEALRKALEKRAEQKKKSWW